MGTHYGGITGLAALGPYSVQVLILPNISTYMKILQPELEVVGQRAFEARKCYDALLSAAGNCLHFFVTQAPPSSAGKLSASIEYYDELYAIFGESLLTYLPQDSVPPAM